jgi:site-specific recombinase XerD
MELVNMENKLPSGHIVEFAGTLTQNTKRAYMGDIVQFFNIKDVSELTIDMVQSVTPSMVNQYIESLLEQGKSPSTINRKMQALSKFYKFLCKRNVGIMDYNPFSSDEGAARFKTKRYSNTRALTDDEVQKIIQTISEDQSILGIRNKIIVLLLATTGMRRGEIAKLKIGDIIMYQENHVIEIMGKGRKERFVVIAKAIKQYIDRYLQLRRLTYMDKDEPLFVSHSSNSEGGTAITAQTVYNKIKKIAKKTGIEANSISPHCFRHTYITNSLEMGCDIEDVQDRVGHADIGSTRRYDHTHRIIKNNPADELANKFIP